VTFKNWKYFLLAAALCITAASLPVTAQESQSYALSVLVDFQLFNGASPYFMSLVQGEDGNLYGTTNWGGKITNCFFDYSYSCGTVFKMTPSGTMTVLHGFDCVDGGRPSGGLVLATDGNFYGTTYWCGTNGNGSDFKVTPKGEVTTLHSFGGQDGAYPVGALVEGVDGNFYGTTRLGGLSNFGTVFRITPAGVLTVLHSFCAESSSSFHVKNCTDGQQPYAGLVQATDGNFYGTTSSGGSAPGTIFKISPDGKLTILHRFCTSAAFRECTDGSSPFAPLIQATDGNFYGTTSEGGTTNNGTVFKITSGALTTLHTFDDFSDGGNPTAGLIQGTDGNFYGTTVSYGDKNYCNGFGCGTAFQITPDRKLTTLHAFQDTDGSQPNGLVQATDGKFYGSAYAGGNLDCLPSYSAPGCGTIFSLDVGLAPFLSFIHAYGRVGQTSGILGQGLTGTTAVSFNNTPSNFTVSSDSFIQAAVPQGATTGYISVTTPSGVLQSNVPFRVIP